MPSSRMIPLLLCAMLLPMTIMATEPHEVPIPKPEKVPAITARTLLEKTIFKADVLTLEVWLGPETARRIERRLLMPDSKASRDSVATVAMDSRDAWAQLVFRRNVSLDQFLGGIDANMRRARDIGWLESNGYKTVSEGLPRYFAPLARRGIKKGDRLFYRIRGDSLRTVFQQVNGRVVVDQIDVGPERRLSLLGSFFVKGSDLRKGLLTSLRRNSGD